MDTSPNTHPNVVDVTTNSLHVNIDEKEINLTITLIETLNAKTKIAAKMRFLYLSKIL